MLSGDYLLTQAALDDIMVTMTFTTWASRLRHLSARGPTERRFAAKLVRMLEHAREMIGHP